LLYSEKYSVQQFLGSFGQTLTKTGEHKYTVDSAKLDKLTKDNLYPGLSELLVGWIPNEVIIKGDTHADELIEVNKVYEEQRSHFDPVKDYIPDYVNMDNMDPSDSAKLSTSNAEINNTVMQKTAAWMSKGGIDEEWDAYCKQLDSIGLQDNIKIWQKWYDTYTK
ncbi:ABC transporter substrate-binding protein, partial [Bifidobacterium longum subsp. infantis]|nr:ABC transporter substrate-binding protein [Bifidobacterium longum subsp. infantis]